MLGLIASIAAAAVAPNAVPEVVGGLQGCWNATGQVRGKNATSVARGDWHIGHLYFMLQLSSTVAGKPYTAAIIYGAGPKPGTIYSYWLDVVGGAAPVPETGSPTKDGFTVGYDFGDSVYTNRFAKTRGGWRWMIIEQVPGKPDRIFAHYDLTPTTCGGKTFDF
jgi:hypothetical protein